MPAQLPLALFLVVRIKCEFIENKTTERENILLLVCNFKFESVKEQTQTICCHSVFCQAENFWYLRRPKKHQDRENYLEL